MRGANRVDAGMAAVFVAAAVVQAVAVDHAVPGLAAFEVTGALWLSTLAVRRQRPLVPICVIAALGVLGSVVTRLVWPDAPDAGGVWILALMLAAYSLGAHASGRVIVLGVLLPMLVVVTTDTTTRDGWARVSGILFVTVFVGLLPTAVGRLVRIRGRRLEILRAQRARIVQEQRAQQRAAVLAERLATTERLQPTLVHGLRALADAAEAGGDPGKIETSARDLLTRTREEVVALTAPLESASDVELPLADHVGALRTASQPWSVLAGGAVAAGMAAESSGVLALTAPAWTVIPAALVVGACLAMAWWRPVLSVALGFVAASAYSRVVAPLDGSLSETALAMTSAFAVAALSSRRMAIVGLGVCEAGQLVGVGTGDPLGEALTLVACWLGGLALNEVSRLVEQTRANNELLAQQETRAAARAVVEERLRLARELHDALGHSLTVAVLQAGAARRFAGRDPARAAEVMHTVSTVAREGAAELTVDKTTADLTALVTRIRNIGLQVTAELGGEASLDPAQQLVAFRVVQEALTNILRHAPGGRARVVVRRVDAAVEIVVANTAGTGQGPGPGTGRGLVGIRERVGAVAGEVGWAAGEDGGFEVRARLPISDLAVVAP